MAALAVSSSRVRRRGWLPTIALVAAAGGAAGRSAARVWGTSLWSVATLALLFDMIVSLRSIGPHSTPRRPSAWRVACWTGAPLAPYAAVVIARQYVERTAPNGMYQGPVLPVALWTTCVAIALGAVAAVCVVGPLCSMVRRPHRCFEVPAVLGSVVAMAFLWRVYALAKIAPARVDGGDPLYYHTQANALARGLGFIEPLHWIAAGQRVPTAVHGPGYTIYLSLFSRLGASTWFDHRMASTLVGTAVVLLAALIGRRLAGNVAGATAALLACWYPNLWTIDIVLFPEGLFIVFCGLSILLAYRWYDHRRRIDAVMLGAAIGAAALTRGEGIFLIVLLCAPLMLRAREVDWRRRWTALGLAVLGCLLVVGPWMVRNVATFEKFVPLSTNGSELNVYTNCKDTYGGKFLGFWLFDCQQRLRDPNGDGTVDFEPPGDESQKAAYWQSVGLDYARHHLSQLPKVVLARIGRQWDVFRPLQNAEFAPIEGRDPDWARAGLACYYALVGAAAFGVRRLRRLRVPLLPLGAQVLAVTLTAAYAYGTTRFRAPVELVLCVLAGVGLAPLVRRATRALCRPLPRDAGTAGAGRAERGGSLRRSWPFVVPALALLAIVRGLFLAPGAPMEEGFMLVFPERMLKGAIPNVSFLHLYGPGSLHLLAAAYSMFGASVGVERTVGLLLDMAIVLALIRLARPWGRTVAALTGVMGILVVFTPIGLTALAWHGAIAFGLWSLVAALRGGRHGAWLTGLLVGLSLSFRPDLIVALAIAHGVRFLVDRRRDEHTGDNLWTGRRGFLAGLAAGLVSLIVHIAIAGPSLVWRGVVVEPVFTLRPGRSLPRPPSWSHLDGALQVIGERPAPWWPVRNLAPAHQLSLWFFVLPTLAVGGVLLAVRWWRADHLPRQRLLLVASAFSTGLLAQAMQRPDSTHLLWGSVVAFPLAGCWLAEAWSHRPTASTSAARLAMAAVPLAFVFLVLPSYTFRTYTMHLRQSLGASHGGLPPGLPVVRGDRSFRLGDVRAWRAGQALVDDLAAKSRPGERLLVGPVDLRQTAYSDVFFYHLFPELVPATRYIEMDPGLANAAGSPLAADVASADWLVLTRYWAGWIEPNTSIVFGPDAPNVVVEQEFCLVGSYEHDLTRLYHRCAGGGAPGPYEGPYDPKFDYAVEVRVPVPPRSDGTYPPGSPAAPSH